MRINSYMGNFFSPLINGSRKLSTFALIILFSTICIAGNAQDFKPELRAVDASGEFITAGLHFTNIDKVNFDQLVTKINGLDQYEIKTDFIDQKNAGYISLRSKGASNLKTLQSLFKQLGLQSVIYNGKTISSQEIEQNYQPVNNSEIKNIERKINFN